MKRRDLLAGMAAMTGVGVPAMAQGAKTRIVFWHSMSAALGDEVNRLCAGFNASQNEAEVVPVFKGTYPETLTAAIAAWRAGQAPNLVQMFEVGTGSMLAAGPAVKQAWELFKETGVDIDPKQYIPAVRGYYSLSDGRLASMPFNSSTPIMWYSKDAFEKAGLDPAKPPATWDETTKVLQAIKDKNAAPVVSTSSWFSWIQFETFGAMHNLPFASKDNGFDGLDAQLEINKPDYVKQLNRFMEMSKEGLFKYGGRDNAPDPLMISGQSAISFASSGLRGDLVKSAKFKWGEAFLPYDSAITQSPLNSIIGGASLWTMTAPNRSAAEYKETAEFLKYLSQPAQDESWHERTGYVAVTYAGFEKAKADGFYAKNQGAELPIEQLARGTMTANSKGLRLGRMPEIRNIIYEEVEKALQGQQSAQAALDSAVARGNRVLREFERANRS